MTTPTTTKNDDGGKNDESGTDGRRQLDPPTHRANFLASQSIFHASILLHMNCNQLPSHPSTRGTRAQGTHDVTTPTPITTQRVGALQQSRPGLFGPPVFSCRDAHGTPVPKKGRPWVARNNFYEDDNRQTTPRHRQALRRTCFQQQV